MCWFGERNDKRIAKEDIRCKKVFFKQLGHIRNRYVSPVMKTMYVKGETYESDIVITRGINRWKIDEGIHCYNMDKVIVKRSFSTCGERLIANLPSTSGADGLHYLYVHYGNDIGMETVLVECTIPKGATYYENTQGEIVTNELLVGEEITVK